MTRNDQIEQLKKDRTQELYGIYRPVVDGIAEELAANTDRLAELGDTYLDQLNELINSYTIVASYLKDDYALNQAEQLAELLELMTRLHDRTKLKAFELQRYAQTAHKSLKEVLEE